VLWSPAFFGVKPEMVLVGGTIACAQMGDPNASIPVQPIYSPPDVRRLRRRPRRLRRHLRLRRRPADGIAARLGLAKSTLPVAGTRAGIGKADMILNDALPAIEVNPETYEVRADGELLTCDPAEVLPMAQRYFLF
jgi:urease subunit alpha